MKVTWSWLSDWVELPDSPEELAHQLALLGLPVQALERGASFDPGIVVGRVLEAGPHPNADRLRLCSVDTGDGARAIVCGASNVVAGQHVAVALPGAKLADGSRLRKSKIRGVESDGMICSKRELGLEAESEGIWPLPFEARPGTPLAEAMGPPDSVLDVEVTPNRTDCESVIGLAREIASQRGVALKPQPGIPSQVKGDLPAVTIESGSDCPRYLARVVTGLRVGPSPEWLRRRLEATGLRSINNVVDVTNYVLREYGQPIHAFDASKVRGNTIAVRRARVGETLTILDGRTPELHAGVLVIADAASPMALAGVMGGLDSGVTDHTATVILECAAFDPVLTRAAARSLGIETDASARFVEGVDIEALPAALDATARLLAEVAGGRVIAGIAEQRPAPTARGAVALRLGRLRQLLGVPVSAQDASRALERLGFTVAQDWSVGTEGEVARFVAPSYRQDIEQEVDLIEEVARIVGYDAIPATLRAVSAGAQATDASLAMEARLVRLVCGLGFDEALSTVLVGTVPPEALPDGPETPLWELQNPKSRELRHLRPSLLPALLAAVARNLHHGASDVRLVEVGKVFRAEPAPLGAERVECALVLAGAPDPWRQPQADPDRFPELKGAVEALLEALGIDSWEARSYDQPCWAAGSGASLVRGAARLGALGQVAGSLASQAGLDQPAWAAVLDVAALFRAVPSRRTHRTLPRFPAAKRDLAVVVDRKVAHGEVVAVIRKSGGPMLHDVRLFDVFEGTQIGAGKKSLAYALEFRATERTLSDREADEALQGIVQALGSALEATIRGGARGGA
jgi:phenylalanyl-tRNA synthetase beta chain